MKRILVYVDSLNASGGIERIVFELIKEWSKKYEVHVLVKDDGKCFYGEISTERIISINCPRVVNMNSRFQRIISTFYNSLKSITKIRKQSINNFDYYYVTTPMNAFELYFSGIEPSKIVVSEHGSAYGVNRIYKVVKRFIYPKVRCISVPNKMDVEIYKQFGSNAVYIPHFVYMKNKGINSLESKIILNCGRLTADKRQIELLEMWNQVENKNGWVLYIVGDGEERRNLITFIENNKLNQFVKLIPATKDIESIYRQASFFAFTSRFEGFGLVLVEAMAYGIPCVSYDCPSGPRDIVNNRKNGFLITNNDREGYINTLKSIVELDEKTIQELGHNAYQFINNWDNDYILSKWYEVFR